MPSDNLVVENTQIPAYPSDASKEMIEAGVFYGCRKSKTNPKMKSCVLMNRGGIEIINLDKTEDYLNDALSFTKEKVRNGSMVLLAATQPSAEEDILKMAKKFGFPYVVNRWPGGTITNFKIISKRIEYLKKLRGDLAGGALDKYTKKERVMIEREIGRLTDLFGGLENLTREPDLLIVIDPRLHSIAVREAKQKGIPVVALGNVDSDPDSVKYLVPGNDNSRKSINWFLTKIESAIEEGLKFKVDVKEEAEKAGAEIKPISNEK